MRPLLEVGVLGGLLLAALVGTYMVYYESDPDSGDGSTGVAVYVANEADVSKVSFTSTDDDVVIERKKDDAGEYLWVTVTSRTEIAPEPPVLEEADTDTDDTDAVADVPEPEPEIEETTTSFVGNDEASKLMKDFAPFEADRQLPQGSADQDFGFDEPFGTITVDRSAGPVTLTIGKPTYGERSRYLRSGDGVYLVAKRIFTRLQSADKTLLERRLSPLLASEVKKLTVTAGEQSRTLVHVNADDKVKAFWADSATPEVKDDLASGWAKKASSLTAKEYVTDVPADLMPVATLTLTGPSEDWVIEVLSDGGEPATHYAKTTFNRGFVSLTASQAEDLVVDLDSVLVPVSSDQ